MVGPRHPYAAGPLSELRLRSARQLAGCCRRWIQRHPYTDRIGELRDLRGIELSLHAMYTVGAAEARAQGHTWAEIGDALALTRQAAHARYRSAQ